jgi:Mrp family chromosome partitioning ATPase
MFERRYSPPAAGRRDEPERSEEAVGYSAYVEPSRPTHYLDNLRERWWVPVLTLALSISGTAAYLALQPPAYASFASLRLNGKQTALERNLASEQLRFSIGTQVGPLQRERILRRTQARLRASSSSFTPGPVRVTITNDPSATVFVLEARGPEPVYTQAYLDAVIEEYLDNERPARPKPEADPHASLAQQVADQEQELKAEQAKLADFERTNNPALLHVQSVSATEPATPAVPVKPPWSLGLAAAGLAGLFVGLAIVSLVARFDDRIRSLTELRAQFDEEILGQVPETSPDQRTNQLKNLEPDDERQMFAESCRNIRSSLLYLASSAGHPKLLLVTSAAPSEGKSTISVNLARALAFAGSRVLLIDADLRRGTLHQHLGLPAEPGLTELLSHQPVAGSDTRAPQPSVRTLAHQAPTAHSKRFPAIARVLAQASGMLDEKLALRINKVMVPTAVPNLFFVPCGQFANNAADLFLNPNAETFLKQVRDRFDYVIADSAPVFAADDTTSLAPRMDGVIFVVRHANTGADLARHALELLYQRRVKVLGLVFNRANPHSRKYHYYKYTSYYGAKKR